VEYYDRDEDLGVVIPFWDQVEDVVCELGSGCSGDVEKIRWKNGFAALKTHKGVFRIATRKMFLI